MLSSSTKDVLPIAPDPTPRLRPQTYKDIKIADPLPTEF